MFKYLDHYYYNKNLRIKNFLSTTTQKSFKEYKISRKLISELISFRSDGIRNSCF